MVTATIYNQKNPDVVHHPAHYQSKNNIEVIDIIESFELNFSLGNALKYILRAGKKNDNKIEDFKKAIWYIEREISIAQAKSASKP